MTGTTTLMELLDDMDAGSDKPHIKYYRDVVQGTDEWFEMRRGLLTASEMKKIITPSTLKPALNDTARGHIHELAAQRISGHVEPGYISDDMLRGKDDEIYATQDYNKHYAPLRTIGFITNNKWGFTLGYSPDALVGDDGQVECKSRAYKYQIETILKGEMPAEYMIQVQTGLLVSERSWCDFISYPARGGLHMMTLRIFPDAKIQEAIVEAAKAFEEHVKDAVNGYHAEIKLAHHRYLPTERRIDIGDLYGQQSTI